MQNLLFLPLFLFVLCSSCDSGKREDASSDSSDTKNETITTDPVANSERKSKELPIVKAVGGDGKSVDWPAIKRKYEAEIGDEGPGYFYNDCDQNLTAENASSTLADQGKYNYNLKNICDFDPMTAWVEGDPGYGIGETFNIKSSAVNNIYNGYQSSPASWLDNSRVKRFKVYQNGVALCYLDLKDEMGRQSFELPNHNQAQSSDENIYTFEIVEVYPGRKWKDVAISEITFSACCVTADTKIEDGDGTVKISDIKEGNRVLTIDLKKGTLDQSEVLKVSKQRHLSLLKIESETKSIELTANHPLYIKNVGFSSISSFMHRKHLSNYDGLVDNIELLVWDEEKKEMRFEKLKKIQLVTGVFETYTIRAMIGGETYVNDGFITRIY